MIKVVVSAHCEGKHAMTKNEARALMRRLRAKGAGVMAYQCHVCGKYHIGGGE